MMENSFYQGKQGECFKLLEQNFEKIKQEYIKTGRPWKLEEYNILYSSNNK